MKNKKIVLAGTLVLALSTSFIFSEKSYAAKDIPSDINKKEKFDKISQMKNEENSQQKELVREFDNELEKEKNSTSENLEKKKDELSITKEENEKLESQNQEINNNITNLESSISEKEKEVEGLEESEENKSYQESKKSFENQSQIYNNLNEEKNKKNIEINENKESINDEEKNIEKIKNIQKENQEKLELSKDKVKEAEKNLENAQKAYDEYLSKKDSDPKNSQEYKNLLKAKEDLKNLEEELRTLEQDKKTKEDKIGEIDKEISKEKDDIKIIDENISKNKKELDEKNAEKKKLENLKKQYNNDLKTATEKEENAKKALDSIDKDQRQKDYDKAKKSMDDAKSRLDQIDNLKKDGAFAFYDWIIKNPKNDEELQDAKEALKALNKYADNVQTRNEDTIYNVQKGNPRDATAIENIKKSIALLKEQNNLRANDENFPESRYPYKTNHLIMAMAMSNADNSYDYNNGHLGHFLVGENLAWGYDNPFDGWYHKEKEIYNFILNKKKELIKNEKLGDSEAENKAIELAKDKYKNIVIGHYTNVMDRYIISGIGFAYYGGYDKVSSATYSWSDRNLMTIDEYEQRFNEFLQSIDKEKAEKHYQQKVNEFNKAKELLNNKDYENAKKAYDEAKKALEDIKTKIKDNELEENKVNQKIEELNGNRNKLKAKRQAGQEKLNEYIKNSGLENYKKELASLNSKINKKNEEKKLLAEKLDKAQKEFDALIADDTTDKLEMEIQQAKNNLTKRQEEVNSDKKILENTSNELAKANKKLENLKEQANKLNADLEEIAENLRKENNKLILAKKDLEEKTLANSEFLTAKKELEKLKDDFEIEKEKYRNSLNKFNLNSEKIAKLSNEISELEDKAKYLSSLDFYKLYNKKTDRKDLLYLNAYVDKYDRLGKKVVINKDAIVISNTDKANAKSSSKKINKSYSNNSKTGVSSIAGILALLNISSVALLKSKKRK